MRLALLAPIVGFALAMSTPAAAQSGSSGEVTFTKDIAPILQRSCQHCHNSSGVAPMPLIDVRGSAAVVARHEDADRPRSARGRDAAVVRRAEHRHPAVQEQSRAQRGGDRADCEVGRRGAPRGNPADMPPPRDFANADKWTIGEPDLVLRSPEVVVPAVGPDKWGSLGLVPTGLTEDRYVSAWKSARSTTSRRAVPTNTVGGRYVLHHMTYSSVVPGAAAGSPRPQMRGRRHELADSRSRPQCRHLSARGRPAARRELVARSERVPPPLERPRDEGASRVRLQVLPEGLQADVPALDAAARQRRRHRREAESGQPGAPLLRGAAGAHEDHHVRAAPPRARRAHVPRSDLGPEHP